MKYFFNCIKKMQSDFQYYIDPTTSQVKRYSTSHVNMAPYFKYIQDLLKNPKETLIWTGFVIAFAVAAVIYIKALKRAEQGRSFGIVGLIMVWIIFNLYIGLFKLSYTTDNVPIITLWLMIFILISIVLIMPLQSTSTDNEARGS